MSFKNTRRNNLLIEHGKNRSKQIDINSLYIYFSDSITRIQYAFEYSGLRKWLRDFIKSSGNLTMTTSANSKLLIPSGSYVHAIRVKGSATGITIIFNGKTYPTITSAVNGDETIPQKHYVENDTYLTVSATSWGKLNIIVFT